MASEALHYATVGELAPLIKERKLSPVELTQALLDRISEVDGQLNSFMTVTGEEALVVARQAEHEIASGKYRGPLHGIPMAVKDLFTTKGVRTTAGSKILADWVPDYDATAFRRLKEAGAIPLGKLGMHEWAYGGTTNNPHFGPVRNPWDTKRIPGGSSGGSGVSVAAGLCPFSLGTDTGGSIRGPANMCGIVGLKPTYGRVSRHGVIPLSYSCDHVGPLARSVRDCAIALQGMAGYDPADPTSARQPVPDYQAKLGMSIKGMKVGVLSSPYYRIPDKRVDLAYQDAQKTLSGMGAQVQEVPVEEAQVSIQAHVLVMAVEALQYHIRYLPSRLDDYGDDVAALLLTGLAYTGADYAWALRVRRLICQRLADILSRVDVVMLPTVGFTAPLIGEDRTEVDGRSLNVGAAMVRYMPLFDSTGLPAISVPSGFTENGLPMGVQFAGRPFDEATALQVAHAYEEETGFTQRHPML